MPYAGMLHFSNACAHQYKSLIEEEACLETDVRFLPLMDALLSNENWLQRIEADGVHISAGRHRLLHERIRRWSALLQWAGLEGGLIPTPA